MGRHLSGRPPCAATSRRANGRGYSCGAHRNEPVAESAGPWAVVRLAPKTHAGLPADVDGSALESRLLSQFGDWSDGDKLVLSLVASTFDRLLEVRREITAAGVVTNGRRGRTVNTTLLRIERQTVSSLAALIKQLN